MGSSAASEEDREEAGPDRSGSTESSGGGDVLQGKRAKKTVERLDLQAPKQKEKLKIGDGTGDKLGDIPRTAHQISRMKPADLKPLHSILYDRPGKVSTMKRNLRLFNGFPFQADSEQFHRKRDKLLKSSNLSNSKLKVVCTVLDLEKKGTHADLIHRILSFLLAPKNSGKRLPVKKRRRSKKKLTSEDSKKKSRPRERSSCSPKKSRTGSKSKAIVMDSSSDDEDEDEDDKTGASATAAESDGEKPADEEEQPSERSDDEEQSSRSDSDRTKKKTAKCQETPTKKRRVKKRSSEELEQPRKKRAAPPPSAAKIQNASDTDSEDDLPLIKMVKTSLSDAELKETLQTLLRDADLEEMTMKKICQKVFDMFPEHDLSRRKDFIKQTVKDVSDHTHARAHAHIDAHSDAHNTWFYFESSLEEQDVMICVKQVLDPDVVSVSFQIIT
uniref:DEK proto-oncogene n=1 Tax=Oryzias latipes TaxID=8090 RepID=A0A3P9KI39_ORYLA